MKHRIYLTYDMATIYLIFILIECSFSIRLWQGITFLLLIYKTHQGYLILILLSVLEFISYEVVEYNICRVIELESSTFT